MDVENLKNLIAAGEGVNIEFKECRNKLNKDLFETVCAFLNRIGGHIFLGVADDGKIIGVDEDSIEQIKKDIVTSMNNPMKMNPTFYLSVEEIDIEGVKVLYIHIPESSQVHRCNGKIYDRNEDGDFEITNNSDLVAGLYLRNSLLTQKIEYFLLLGCKIWNQIYLPESGLWQKTKRETIPGPQWMI